MRITVTGAAGSLGRRVVEVAVADYADPSALRAALKGVDTLVFVSSDGPDAQARPGC